MQALRLVSTINQTHDEWLDVPGFEGLYKISNKGEILSAERNGTKGGLLKTSLDRYGYVKAVLNKNNKQHHFTVHRLVALAFIPNELNKPQVNHINGNRVDNDLSNLEWSTAKENVHHSFQFGKQTTVMRSVEATHIRTKETSVFPSQREAAKKLGIGQANISSVLRGVYKQANGYTFQYLGESV
jgi:hypothetical protein